MKSINSTKRFLSILLCAVMLIGILPVFPIRSSAAQTNGSGNYISLPITIRDYAADGMLFEFNQVGATGTVTVGGAKPNAAFTENTGLGAATQSSKSGYIQYKATTTGTYITYAISGNQTRASLRYVVLKYRTNSAQASSTTPQISLRTDNGDTPNYSNLPTDGYNSSNWTTVVFDTGSTSASVVSHVSIFPRLPEGKTIDIAYIAFFANKSDAETYKSNDGKYVPAATYNQADTLGFSLLATSNKDRFNDLSADSIEGTTLYTNGKWDDTSEPSPMSTTLNSGAKQEIYGAYIRTDLVGARLVNGQPEYTEATVTYLAGYMKKIMAEPEQNADKSYNTFFVKGHKLDVLGGKDLAAVIREQVKDNELGTYAASKAKFDSGKLGEYTDIETWFDAAYFLLHNTFRDSIGYGTTVGEYKSLDLVQATNSEGKTCYVFNSGYDDTKYNYTEGYIRNLQTDVLTIAKTNSGVEQYIRGNKLPDARFDPLGLSGGGKIFGYGLSGDTYGDMISASTADWADYYDSTNYHLSLDCHAQFIYYHDDDLYFTFTGDDDVYLFINGIRVLDLGAAHSISKVKVSLNDVAELCGLEDGKAYDFDFFYMERHGTAANFGIETNIKIVDPSMLTQKTGYQDGAEVGYNGFIDPNKPVSYCFTLTNNGKVPLKNLEFLDNDIGVSITKDTIKLNSDTTIDDLLLALYNADGSVKTYIRRGSLTEAALKQALADGIAVGERILIHGFKYKIPAGKWVTSGGSTYFHNTVYTVGEASSEILRGIADYRVQKPTHVFTGNHFYTVGELKSGSGEELKVPSSITGNITENEILAMVNAGLGSNTLGGFDSINICSASGNINANKNSRASVSGKTINYSTPVTGTDNFYFLVNKGSVSYGPIHISVYNYGWSNDAYVIDYNLPVELNDTSLGITANDSLINGNPHINRTAVSALNVTSEYGSFAVTSTQSQALFGGFSLKYTMSKFMSGIDSASVTVSIAEGEAAPDNRTNGVTFTEKVEVLPASVMYYEDDFVDIGYCGAWETSGANGAQQSADQTSCYGSDPNYSDDTVSPDAFGGTASNGTIRKLTLAPDTKTTEIMYFDFVGTGFELISRATKDHYSIISVEVYEWNEDNTPPAKNGNYYSAGDYNKDGDNTEAYRPVITESEGGDVYEVPVIKLDKLPYSKYRVAVYAANTGSSTKRVVYIDGIRISRPLTSELEEKYYSAGEANAEFSEIRPLVLESKITYLDISNGTITWGTGTTVVEDKDDDNANSVFQAAESGTTDYLYLGPNNEIYLDAHAKGDGENASLLAFYITKTRGFTDEQRTLQLGVHRKIDTNPVTAQDKGGVIETGAVYLAYGSTAADFASGISGANGNTANYIAIKSGTEQYISIDPSMLSFDADGKALVLVGTFGGENAGSNILALTNIKLKGYELSACGEEIANGTSGSIDTPMFAQAFSLRSMMAVAEDEETEAPSVPGMPGLDGIPKDPVLPGEKVDDGIPEMLHAYALYNVVPNGTMAIINAEASGDTESLLILDDEGNEVEHIVLNVSKQTDLIVFLTALFSGRWDLIPEEKTVFMIGITVTGADNNYSIYAVREDGTISPDAVNVNIRTIPSPKGMVKYSYNCR